ncbi:MAG: cation:proton antiporter, partial [Paracoccaceae bacterium]
VMAGSTLSAQAMRDSLPFRDAFAVLFFVSVGMLFNPAILWEQPFSVMVTVLIVLGFKSITAYGMVVAMGHDRPTARTIAAALAQIGEFSFIVIVMGVNLEIVPTDARDLVVAGAIASILLNPVMFHWLGRMGTEPANAPVAGVPADATSATVSQNT